jgi:ABC-type transport system involved in multi-copper enzyme maturation permease subunit
VSKARDYIVIIGSMIVIGIILYVISYFLIITLPQPWIALVLVIVLFCCAIPLHSWIVGKLTSSKAKNVQ